MPPQKIKELSGESYSSSVAHMQTENRRGMPLAAGSLFFSMLAGSCLMYLGYFSHVCAFSVSAPSHANGKRTPWWEESESLHVANEHF